MNQQSQAVKLDPVLEQALFDVKLRMFILRREQSIVQLLTTPELQSMETDPMNGFFRLLSHKVGDYYKIGHTSKGDTGSVIYFKVQNQGHVSFPAIQLAEIHPPRGTFTFDWSQQQYPTNSTSNHPFPNFSSPSQSGEMGARVGKEAGTTMSHFQDSMALDSRDGVLTRTPRSSSSPSSVVTSVSPKPGLMKKPILLRKPEGSRSAPASGHATPNLLAEDQKGSVPHICRSVDSSTVSIAIAAATAKGTEASGSQSDTSISKKNSGECTLPILDNGGDMNSEAAFIGEHSSAELKRDQSSLKGLSFDERVALYEAARARIFEGFQEEEEEEEEQQSLSYSNDRQRSEPTSPAVSRPESRGSQFKFNPEQSAFVPR